MQKGWMFFIKQHAPAVIIFLILSIGYCNPVLEGKKIIQSDIIQSLAMQGEMNRYKKNYNQHILWTNSMFSGMPTFMLKAYSAFNILGNGMVAFQQLLPNPIYLIFFCLLGMYILCQAIGIDRWLSVLAAVAFAFGTYNILSIEAGHTSKVRSIALMAPVLAGVITTLKGYFVAGWLLTTIFASLQLTSNHLQITYYTLMITILLLFLEGVKHMLQKKVLHFVKILGVLSLAGIIAMGCNLYLLWPAYEYSKETIRGGVSELSYKKTKQKNRGLDREYAFAWSQGIMESLTFLVPNFSGGSSGESLDENSETYKTLIRHGLGTKLAKIFVKQVPTYWGDQPFTAGPIYFGASVVLLLLYSIFTVRHPLYSWLLATMLLALFLSWGKNVPFLSDFFFEYVPMYNKFRTPSMMLSVVQLIIPLFIGIAIHQLCQGQIERERALLSLKIAAGIVLGVCVLLYVGSALFGFSAEKNGSDREYYEQLHKVSNDETFAHDMIVALKKDRETIMKRDAIRSGIFAALTAAWVFLFVAQKIRYPLFIVGTMLLVAIDLFQIDMRYLNENSYRDDTEYQAHFRMRKADMIILRDPDIHYRVHDITADPFNNASPSYYHKTIGGYHAAKLQRYQDIIEHHLSKGHLQVFNMLNTKYYIVNDETGNAVVRQNPFALGNAWFVKNIRWVEGADEEISALADFSPDSVVIIDQRFRDALNDLPERFTQAGEIKLINYHPDKLVYTSQTSDIQLAVFSEIYYKGNDDWKSYIDGREVPHIRVNYLLRAIIVPPGHHEIVFEFKPKSYYHGQKVTMVANVALLLALAGYAARLITKKHQD